MCGLAFLKSHRLNESERHVRVGRALDSMLHRGPDARASISGENFTTGHLRLAIVDLAGGAQPMTDPSGRWTLVFNGEIYNFRALRESLVGRWSFRDSSDTELLLAGLIVEGHSFIARLEGMWAFVLYDSLEDVVLASRDRFGKKPLYFRMEEGVTGFASELPALRMLYPDISWRESESDVSDYFRFGYTMPGATCFQNTSEVLPAHWLKLHPDGRQEQTRYWLPSIEPVDVTFDEAAEEVRMLLARAVEARQLASDVEVGAFLSGGVDSTVICALAKRTGTGNLRTFTAGFAESTYDERPHAARAAQELQTLHVAEELRAADAMPLARTLSMRMGQPFGDASLVPTALVSQVAGRHVKVVLTGDGGDEVFGGYARYAGRLLRDRYRKLPSFVRAGIEKSVLAFPEPFSHHSGSFLKRAHLFVALVREPSGAYIAPPAIRAATLQRLMARQCIGRRMPSAPWLGAGDDVRQMMLRDWLVWLPQDILAKVDRASMAYSVEARSPFLDRELVEYVLRLPWHWHFDGLKGKRLLKAAMRGHAPDFIWSRRKQGFASPVAHWLRGKLGDEIVEMSDLLVGTMVDRNEVVRLLTEHRGGAVDHSQSLWLVYSYLLWREGL